jgi:two-component system response regulator AtoC
MKDAISMLEKDMITKVLEKHKGNKSVAAKELGISRSSLISKVQDYMLE